MPNNNWSNRPKLGQIRPDGVQTKQTGPNGAKQGQMGPNKAPDLVKIRLGTAEKLMTLSLCGGGGWSKVIFMSNPSFELSCG